MEYKQPPQQSKKRKQYSSVSKIPTKEDQPSQTWLSKGDRVWWKDLENEMLEGTYIQKTKHKTIYDPCMIICDGHAQRKCYFTIVSQTEIQKSIKSDSAEEKELIGQALDRVYQDELAKQIRKEEHKYYKKLIKGFKVGDAVKIITMDDQVGVIEKIKGVTLVVQTLSDEHNVRVKDVRKI